MSETVETKVAEFLATQNIKFSVAGGIATKRDDWECDAWITSFSRVRNGKTVSFNSDYYTGIGHRQLTAYGKVQIRNTGKSSARYIESIKRAHSKAVAPKAAGVLYSLLSDASSAEGNFLDWCADFGADPDSIKALHTYNACSETLAKIRSFFTTEERETMQSMLEDY